MGADGKITQVAEAVIMALAMHAGIRQTPVAHMPHSGMYLSRRARMRHPRRCIMVHMTFPRAVAFKVAIAGFLFLVLAYAADFSMRQSIVLAILGAWLGLEIETEHVRRFSPYYVWVCPNWYQLLTDFKLIGKPEEWEAIQKSFKELPPTEYRVLRSGIHFTVVHQSDDFRRTLIYSNNHRAFVSHIDFQEDIEPIRIDREGLFAALDMYDVAFYVKGGVDGYDLGIHAPDSWWEGVKASCPKPMEESGGPSEGTVNLTLAKISYHEFDLYWSPLDWWSTSFHKTAKQIKARRDADRDRLGWKRFEYSRNPEVPRNYPECIIQKYFRVEHDAI
jgi:hypothetical protein